MGSTSSLNDKYKIEGVQFVKPSNKTLRLYFESQFTKDIDDEDFKFIFHIFEKKVFLYYNEHYDRSNLIDVEDFMDLTLEKLLDNVKFKALMPITIERSSTVSNPFFQILTFKGRTLLVNHDLKVENHSLESTSVLYISDPLIERLRGCNNIKIFIKLNYNTNLLWFILNRVIKAYCINAVKLTVYQVGLSTVDEEMYTILSKFLNEDQKIHTLKIKPRSIEQYCNNDEDMLNNSQIDDLKVITNIQNKQHFFNFYQILNKKTYLVSLTVLLFLTEYNLILITDVIRSNPLLENICIRNMIPASTTHSQLTELDFGFSVYQSLGVKIKDEIFCFFNFCFKLNYLKRFKLTHFWFNSDLNFFACELAKNVKSLAIVDLEGNQALVGSDDILKNQFSFADTSLKKLNIGNTYFYMIRSFKNLINCETLKDLNVGILDFVSMISLLKFISYTRIEVLKLTLNKTCDRGSLKVLFDFVRDFVITSRFLKFLFMCNTYIIDYENQEDTLFLENLIKTTIFERLNDNMIIRTLSFNEGSENYTRLKKFKYIHYYRYTHCYAIYFLITRLFPKMMKLEGDPINKLIQLVLMHLFLEYRKIII